MTYNFRHEGMSIDHTPGTALAAGTLVSQGTPGVLGITVNDIAANKLGALQIQGVFEATKVSSTDVFAVGDDLQDDGTGLAAEAWVSGPKMICVKASANGDATVWVALALGT